MMSDFDYSLDVDAAHESFDDDQNEWDDSRPAPGPMYHTRRPNSGYMNAQYCEAFGDYRGGYGPGGGFGAVRPRPYPPGPMRGRGFGPIGQPPMRPRGPPIHAAAQFLADCDINPQYIRHLPWILLDMIQPGFCGLCSQNLESFGVAKIHYNCKNHYKAQKKFMAQYRSNKRNAINNEVPLKARNLYCELCDVHLTSKAHAESHYSGKSHHSIVEGRKPPRNSILLQAGMEGRVEQLIRREKKSLKAPAASAPTVEIKQASSFVADKNVPPELVCQICKTSVTCSEQMTSHLNGKRHLTKEKQHILKMMKGEADKKKAQEEDEEGQEGEEEDIENNGDNAQEEGSEEQEETAAEENDDWASGGGAEWDAQNTAQPSDADVQVEL